MKTILARVGEIEAACAGIRADLAAAPAPAAPAPSVPASSGPPASPNDGAVRALANPKAFFDTMRATRWLGPALSAEEVAGLSADLEACGRAGLTAAETAYVIATDYHETAGTMRPIREYGRGKGRPYGKPGRNGGQVAYGRGRVQLTWDENYERMDRELGLNGALIANYDLALDERLASEIMIVGMTKGLFNGQGKGLRHYLPAETATREQFKAARRTVNVQDKADLIAGYALDAQEALVAGGWG